MTKPLPDPIDIPDQECTWEAPHVLLGAELLGERVVYSIREGGAVQVELRTRIEWAEAPVQDPVFAIRALNTVNFGGQTLSVINDDTAIAERLLPATAPTAREYRALLGQWVLVHCACAMDDDETQHRGVPTYKIARNFIRLP